MLSQLIEFIKSIASDLVPVARLDQWEAGVILRFGRFHREIGPGWHWKIPFIESLEQTTIVTTTSRLPAQSLTTVDGCGVVVEAVVKYSVSDVKKLLLEVTDRHDAINDTVMGEIARQIRGRKWDECNADSEDPLEAAITKRSRVLLRRWGVAVEDVTICSLAKMRSIRIIGEFQPHE